ncbi:MAG TPA: FtsX-like permease family protein [Solirubrobacteraceae bacterium]|nr:FtsX-like permease family protein [Solirubrobacteraceae bacterium]
MIGVALRGLAGRKFRTVLTAIAIVLGVAMMSGAYVLTDTIDKAFNAIFVESYAGTDAVVSGKGADISFEGEQSEAPPIPEDVLEQVRAVDGVEVATGSVTDFQTKLLKPDGESIDTGGAPSFAFGIETAPEYDRFNPLNLVGGRWPKGARELAIDEGVADDESLAVGDRIGVAALGPAREYEIVGIARYGDVSSLGGATFAIFDVPTAQTLLDKKGELDAVQAAAQDGIAPEELVASIRRELGTSVTVRSGSEQADEDSSEVATFTNIIRYFLLTFAGIALFVGAFVIFNTLSITVAQRTREFATLRTVGASRRQVLGSVILEALVIGLFASIIGLFAGLGLAVGLNALFRGLNLDLPQTETVFATRTIVVSLLVGTVVTLVAGLSPALRATRVPPIAAVREGAKLPRSALSRFGPYIAVATIVLAVLALSYAMLAPDVATGDRFILLGVGVLALFIGVALLSSRLVVPLTRLVGLPARRIGGPSGTLAEGNAIRDPGRTASTAAALMIGIALVTFVGVLAQGLRVSNSDAIEEQIQADLVVTSQDGYSEFPAAVGDAAAKLEGTDLVSNVRQDVAEVDGSGANLTGLDGSSINQVYSFRWTDGSDEVLAGLGDDGAVVPDNVADDKDLAVGDSFTVLTTDNERREFVVRGIYDGSPFYPLLGTASISQEAFDELYERPRNRFTLINVPGAPGAGPKTSVERGLETFPDTRVQTRQEWIDKEDEEISQFLLLLYVLLALSVIVSLFGMVNTLALSVFERTRELGMLRAIGMTRRQTRRMVRHESVITALIGAALGLPLGIFLALLVTQALSEYDLQFAIPIGALITFVIVSVIAGVVAAILPARRAARLRVLEALQYE